MSQGLVADSRATLTAVESTEPIVFLLFDEFPLVSILDEHSQIDSVRYPHLAKLSQESYWFRNTTSVSDDTVAGAVGSLVTGRYPKNAQDPKGSLFEWLGGTLDLNVFEPYTNYCPQGWNEAYLPFEARVRLLLTDTAVVLGHIILPEPWAHALPGIAHDWKNFGAKPARDADVDPFLGDRMAIWRQFIDRIHSDGPQLSFVHILMPHVPFTYLRGETLCWKPKTGWEFRG